MQSTTVDSLCEHLAKAAAHGAVIGISVECHVAQLLEFGVTVAVCGDCRHSHRVALYSSADEPIKCWEAGMSVRQLATDRGWEFDLTDADRKAHLACAHIRETLIAARYGDHSFGRFTAAYLVHADTNVRALICGDCTDRVVTDQSISVAPIPDAYVFDVQASGLSN